MPEIEPLFESDGKPTFREKYLAYRQDYLARPKVIARTLRRREHYCATHRKELAERNRKYRRDHRDDPEYKRKRSEYQKKYYLANIEKLRRYNREYWRDHHKHG